MQKHMEEEECQSRTLISGVQSLSLGTPCPSSEGTLSEEAEIGALAPCTSSSCLGLACSPDNYLQPQEGSRADAWSSHALDD